MALIRKTIFLAEVLHLIPAKYNALKSLFLVCKEKIFSLFALLQYFNDPKDLAACIFQWSPHIITCFLRLFFLFLVFIEQDLQQNQIVHVFAKKLHLATLQKGRNEMTSKFSLLSLSIIIFNYYFHTLYSFFFDFFFGFKFNLEFDFFWFLIEWSF